MRMFLFCLAAASLLAASSSCQQEEVQNPGDAPVENGLDGESRALMNFHIGGPTTLPNNSSGTYYALDYPYGTTLKWSTTGGTLVFNNGGDANILNVGVINGTVVITVDVYRESTWVDQRSLEIKVGSTRPIEGGGNNPLDPGPIVDPGPISNN